MKRRLACAVLFLIASTGLIQAQAPTAAPAVRPAFHEFEVATIKPVESDAKSARFLTMQGTHRFLGKNYTLQLLIAAAYDLSPKTISGGPAWIETDHFDIQAITPGEARPSRAEQMTMLRSLLADRFKLTFHREPKEFSIYALEAAKGGAKLADLPASGLKLSTAAPDEPPALISTVYPQRILLPARNASMGDFASLLQRAVLDRPVVDRTGLSGRFDFDLAWAPDETQFGGEIAPAPADAKEPPLFAAVQEQLGLRLVATRGSVEALVVDSADRPTEN